MTALQIVVMAAVVAVAVTAGTAVGILLALWALVTHVPSTSTAGKPPHDRAD